MAKSNYLRYQWTSIWLGSGTSLGIIFVICLAVADSLNAGVLLLWSMAYLAIGGLVGFIFSVPKIITDSGQSSAPAPQGAATTLTPPKKTAGEVSNQPATSGAPQIASSAQISAASPAAIATAKIVKVKAQENTNLTQISDWLTKILIGAGLVQIKEVPGFVHHIATVMGSGLADTKDLNASNTVAMICAAIILYFITWGFISGYLVMKLVLTEQFVNSSDSE